MFIGSPKTILHIILTWYSLWNTNCIWSQKLFWKKNCTKNLILAKSFRTWKCSAKTFYEPSILFFYLNSYLRQLILDQKLNLIQILSKGLSMLQSGVFFSHFPLKSEVKIYNRVFILFCFFWLFKVVLLITCVHFSGLLFRWTLHFGPAYGC